MKNNIKTIGDLAWEHLRDNRFQPGFSANSFKQGYIKALEDNKHKKKNRAKKK